MPDGGRGPARLFTAEMSRPMALLPWIPGAITGRLMNGNGISLRESRKQRWLRFVGAPTPAGRSVQQTSSASWNNGRIGGWHHEKMDVLTSGLRGLSRINSLLLANSSIPHPTHRHPFGSTSRLALWQDVSSLASGFLRVTFRLSPVFHFSLKKEIIPPNVTTVQKIAASHLSGAPATIATMLATRVTATVITCSQVFARECASCLLDTVIKVPSSLDDAYCHSYRVSSRLVPKTARFWRALPPFFQLRQQCFPHHSTYRRS
jgi:hypothetical protein